MAARARNAGFLALSGLLAMALGAPALSAPEQANRPPTPVLEQNVDEGGAIRVHEQGTADVNVTNERLAVSGDISVQNFPSEFDVLVRNFPASQDVRVTNLPATQDVNVSGGTINANVALPAVSRAGSLRASVANGERRTETFDTINATAVSISASDGDEYRFGFLTPLAVQPLGGPDLGGMILRIENPDGDNLHQTHTFMFPVPINGVIIECLNESDVCIFNVTVLGF